MNKNHIIYAMLLILLSASSLAFGQTDSIKGKHSLEFSIIPSFNRLSYKSADNSSEGALGLGLKFGYTYHLTNRWGLGVGLRYQPFSSSYKNQGYQISSELLTEPNGHNYIINQTLNNTEKQRVKYLMIPVVASYRFPINEKISIRLATGAAYGLAFAEKLTFSSGSLQRAAYFPDNDLVVDNLPEQSFGYFNDYVNMASGKQFKNTIMGIGEVGAEYAMNDKWLMTAAMSGVIGSDIKKNNESLLQHNGYSGVTSSNYVGAVKPVSLGLALGIIYRFGRNHQKPVEYVTVAPSISPRIETVPENIPEEVEEPVAENEEVIAEVEDVIVIDIHEEDTSLDELREKVDRFNESDVIQFSFNKLEMREETKTLLDRLVKTMAESQTETIVVGHTCSIGSDAANHRVGLERANSVKRYLVQRGVAAEKIHIESMGEINPKYPNDTPINRAKNRRVEIIVK
ncbi:OmpA family protein [Alkaliflexus imshenetskii]|uniref:OmpA family protein n=1 Tax=Alkaliflexus imshenetskii TaxID=286730 RepID=UPI0004B8CFC2|nr:OmpA family protein [Alkaliflexus imshenetskii]